MGGSSFMCNVVGLQKLFSIRHSSFPFPRSKDFEWVTEEFNQGSIIFPLSTCLDPTRTLSASRRWPTNRHTESPTNTGAIMMITAGAKGVFLMKKLRRVKLKFSERGGTDDDESVSLSAVLPCRSFWNFRSASLPGHISTVTSHYRGRCTRVLPHVYSLALSLSPLCVSIPSSLSKYSWGAFNELLVYARVARHHHHLVSLLSPLAIVYLVPFTCLPLPCHLSSSLSHFSIHPGPNI